MKPSSKKRSNRTMELEPTHTPPPDPRNRIRDPRLLKRMNQFLKDVQLTNEDYVGKGSSSIASQLASSSSGLSAARNVSDDWNEPTPAAATLSNEDKAATKNKDAGLTLNTFKTGDTQGGSGKTMAGSQQILQTADDEGWDNTDSNGAPIKQNAKNESDDWETPFSVQIQHTASSEVKFIKSSRGGNVTARTPTTRYFQTSEIPKSTPPQADVQHQTRGNTQTSNPPIKKFPDKGTSSDSPKATNPSTFHNIRTPERNRASDNRRDDNWGISPTDNAAQQTRTPNKSTILCINQPQSVNKSSNDWNDWDETAAILTPAKSSPTAKLTSKVSSANDDWGTTTTSVTAPVIKSNDDWDDSGWNSTPAPPAEKKRNNDWDDWSTPKSSITEKSNNGGWGSAGNTNWGGRECNRGRGPGDGGFRGGRVPREPRADDWICINSSCGINNFASRRVCFKCSTDRPAGIGGDYAPRNNFGRGGSFNANYQQPKDNSTWSSKPRYYPSVADEPWGNVPSSTATSFQSHARRDVSTEHNRKVKHSKSKKRRRQSSSSSTSSSSSSSSSSSDEHYSKKSKKRKYKKRSKERYGHDTVPYYSHQQQRIFNSTFQGNESIRVSREHRVNLNHISKADTCTQTSSFPDYTLDVPDTNPYNEGLPLSYRFAAVSQNEGGGPGVLGTILVSKKAATREVKEPKRLVKTVPAEFVSVPKTQDKSMVNRPKLCVAITNAKADIKETSDLIDSQNNDKADSKVVTIHKPPLECGRGQVHKLNPSSPENTEILEPDWLKDTIEETKTNPTVSEIDQPSTSIMKSEKNLVISSSDPVSQMNVGTDVQTQKQICDDDDW